MVGSAKPENAAMGRKVHAAGDNLFRHKISKETKGKKKEKPKHKR